MSMLQENVTASRWPAVLPQAAPNWYALYTRSNFEKRVAADLLAAGVDAYLPLVVQVHRWKDRKKVVESPVFPGYVFVRMIDSPESRLRVVRTTGAVRILGGANSIEPIADTEVESVRQLAASKLPLAPYPFLREGMRVRVRRGALQGLEGFLVRVKSQERLVISVGLLSQSVAVETDACDIEPCQSFGRPPCIRI